MSGVRHITGIPKATVATVTPVDSTSGSAAPRTTCAPGSPVGAAAALRLPATSRQPPTRDIWLLPLLYFKI